MTEDELAVFDILTRPAPDLNTEERNEVKRSTGNSWQDSRSCVLDWRNRQAARAIIENAIKDIFDAGLPPAYQPISTTRSAHRC